MQQKRIRTSFKKKKRKRTLGTSLVVKLGCHFRLGLRASVQGVQVQCLVRELRSHMPCSAPKKDKGY